MAPPKINSISAAQFKARCLHLMDQVNETGISIVITKRGKPVASLVPVEQKKKGFRPLLGRMKGNITIVGDIVGPLPNDWEADRD